jgi:hypothetical protein
LAKALVGAFFYLRYGGDTAQLEPNFVSKKEGITR